MTDSRIFTVTEINTSIRGLLEVHFPFVSVAGEISNLRQPLSGHCYFTLKDERSQLKAVLFKMQQRYLTESPADGRMVVCRGRISVYEPRGEYQLIVDTIDFHGAGVMQLEFEKLKQRLAAEGLFDKEAKRSLPFFPEHITLVTSPSGAAVRDFIRVARKRCPQARLTVFPVPVQGETASSEIAKALELINRKWPTDIIVLCRGGGSIEDLWAFNEERLARAIHASSIPVVSAIGHETDFTIADFTADLRAPTPSAAAEMILPDARELKLQVLRLEKLLAGRMASRLERMQERVALCRQRLTLLRHPLDHLALKLDHAAGRLHGACLSLFRARQHSLERLAYRIKRFDPALLLVREQRRLAEIHRRLLLAISGDLEKRRSSLARLSGLLDAVSPLATLSRGYAIARTTPAPGRVITDVAQVETKETIAVTLYKGELECLIMKKKGDGEEKGKEKK
ncbi:MAG: exodeoxyribonuclease VII large subunit [Desulfobulbaceae bacterium]